MRRVVVSVWWAVDLAMHEKGGGVSVVGSRSEWQQSANRLAISIESRLS